MLRFLIACSLLSPFVNSARGQTLPVPATYTYANVGTSGHPLLLDVYIPTTGASSYPVVIYVHGGGWRDPSIDRTDVPPGCVALFAADIAIVSIDYRLTSLVGIGGRTTFPAQIHDVKAAIRWVHANPSSLAFDTSRVGIFGQSAGAHLAILAAVSNGVPVLEGTEGMFTYASSCVDVAAGYYGIYDFQNVQSDVMIPLSADHNAPSSPESALFGWDGVGQGLGDIVLNWSSGVAPYPTLVANVVNATPLTWIDPLDPPLLLLHGTADVQSPVNQSSRLSASLYAGTVRHDFRAIPGGLHRPFGPAAEALLVDHFVSFFSSALPAQPGTTFCHGDSSSVVPCPCANESQVDARQGCKNSFLVGARITAEGVASIGADSLVLRCANMPNNTALYVQSTSSGTAVPFDDGLSCLSGTPLNLASTVNALGFSQLPVVGGSSISALGMPVAGTTYHYQCYYRNPASYCTSATNNWSSAISVPWTM